MTDRELLELAAKAAGIKGEALYTEGLGAWISKQNLSVWSPLTDDGDALRLAVMLGMTVNVVNGLAGWTNVDAWLNETRMGAREPHNADPHKATRRAIVRAAAVIGKAM